MMRALLRPLCAAAVVAGVVAFVVPAPASPASASATAPTCRGQVATIAPDADGLYLGTDGPDVIVVALPESRVESGAGDDLICVDAAQDTKVDAGAGEDGVYVRDLSTYKKFRVETLGPGDDTFVGGPGDDTVTGAIETNPSFDQGYDQIATHGGDDRVSLSSDGSGAHHVDLDLGEGDDGVTTLGDGVTPDSTLSGGVGYDFLYLSADDQGTDVVFDARSHTIDRGGRIVSSWDSFESYWIGEYGAKVRFEGTSGRDDVYIVTHVVDVTMRGGRDVVNLVADKGAVRGGGGRDKIIANWGGTHINLAQQELVWRGNRVALTSFQDASSAEGKVTGSREDNTIVVGSCWTVRGGGGDDRISELDPYLRVPRPDFCTDFVAYGGPGNDVLNGSLGPDRLIGGLGRDVAYGKKGRDVCLVERAYNC